ncbi:MAG: nucleotide exchange factor GrpE [Chloroflexaceae bacterium]|nr:nucleotide exchange factor GrpE [Chloroflexaceae bacterium]
MIDTPKPAETAADNPELATNHGTTGNSPDNGTTLADSDTAPPDSPPAEKSPEELRQDIAALTQQLQEQLQQTESFKGQYLRIAADFENFRRRTLNEKQELEQQVKGNTIKELLPVIDNFERARLQIKPSSDGEMAIQNSYQGVYKNLVDSLKRLGVSAMRPEGKPFDPNYHEAMLREATDAHPEGTVMEQLVRGYLLGDRVLRHAMVKVATAPEPVVISEQEAANAPEFDLSLSSEEADEQQ